MITKSIERSERDFWIHSELEEPKILSELSVDV